MTNSMNGGCSSYRKMETSDETLFTKTMKSLTGVGYHPFCVSTQVVSGTNYRFLCAATEMFPGALPYNAVVTIYVPLPGQGDSVITEIKKVTIV